MKRNIQHNDIPHNALNTDCCYAKFHLCWVSFMLSVANKPILLSVDRLNVIMPSDIILSVIVPIVLRYTMCFGVA
jgi:hypothetical protein